MKLNVHLLVIIPFLTIRATQGGSSMQIGNGFHMAQGGSGLHGGGGSQGGIVLFNNTGLNVRRNSTRCVQC